MSFKRVFYKRTWKYLQSCSWVVLLIHTYHMHNFEKTSSLVEKCLLSVYLTSVRTNVQGNIYVDHEYSVCIIIDTDIVQS